MNRIQIIRRLAVILTGLADAVLAPAAAVPAAFALPGPSVGGGTGTLPSPPREKAIAVGGTPGWQIALIAAGAAVLAAPSA